jgi:hypothetical protein
MAPAFRDVDLDEIDAGDLTCVVTYRPQMGALQRSIAHAGVLTPLHLRALDGRERLQLVSGWKRLLACQQTEHLHVPALVYEVGELSDESALLLAVYENLGCRSLNAVEKGRVLQRLREWFHYPDDELVKTWCPRLEIAPRLDGLEAHCTLTTLDEALQDGVIANTLPLETALWIGRQEAPDREVLLPLFTDLKLGQNRAREFVSLIDEICLRDGCRVVQLWEALGLADLLNDTALLAPQRVEALRRQLRTRRYPMLRAHEVQFEAARRQLRLPSQISLQPPPYFDGPEYQVSFRFGSREALTACAQKLLESASTEALEAMLRLLRCS